MQSIEQILKKNNLSITYARKIVFDQLLQGNAYSMKELCLTLKNKIDRASIYRTVSLFEKIGISRRINIGWKYKIELSDTFRPHHHHLQCTDCSKLIDIHEIELQKVEATLKNIANQHNFKLKNHQLELQGLCSTCQSHYN